MYKRRPPEDIARHGLNGIERRCRTCRRWKPQDFTHYYRAKHGTCWQSECRVCAKARDQRRWLQKRASAPCELAVVLGLTPR